MKNNESEYSITYQDNSNEFIGIKVENGKPRFYLPRCIRLSQNKKRRNKELYLFLKSFQLLKNHLEFINKTNTGNLSCSWPIESYRWILMDYIENGLYYKREKVTSLNKGKINWKKTLKSTPVVSNYNVIYTRLLTINNSFIDDKITEIYKYCIMISSVRIGWLFNIYPQLEYDKGISLKEMVNIVKKEYHSSFDDIKKMRYRHMLSVLNNSNELDLASNYHVFGTKSYYSIYEKMIDKLFNGISEKEKKHFFPQGEWHLYPNEDSIIKSSELRPDTIYHVEKDGKCYTYIFDSKMYKYGLFNSRSEIINSLPKTDSIQKQITYAEYIAHYIYKKSNVRNIFVLPFDKEKCNLEYIDFLDNNHNIGYIGYANGEWRKSRSNAKKYCLLEDYDYIFTFLIDYMYLLNHYNKNDTQILNIVLSNIEEKLQVIKEEGL